MNINKFADVIGSASIQHYDFNTDPEGNTTFQPDYVMQEGREITQGEAVAVDNEQLMMNYINGSLSEKDMLESIQRTLNAEQFNVEEIFRQINNG